MRCFNFVWLTIGSIFLVACGDDGVSAQSGTMTDPRDGRTYQTVTIGSQTWMAEDLKYDIECNGCSEWDTYGFRYKSGMIIADEICPSGWHVPDTTEWKNLFYAVGGMDVAGKMLRVYADGLASITTCYLEDGYSYMCGKCEGMDLGEDNPYGFSGYGGYWSGPGYYLGENYIILDNACDEFAAHVYIGSPGWPLAVRCVKDGNSGSDAKTNISQKVAEVVNGSVVDPRDGQKYKVVTIGMQTWMAENLNYGSKESYCYADDVSNCSKYGRLYTWNAAMQACLSGWHLPSEDEWKTLFAVVDDEWESRLAAVNDPEREYLIPVVGDQSWTGYFLKSSSGWNGSSIGKDAFGFSALPAGEGNITDGSFNGKGDVAAFWCSTEHELYGSLIPFGVILYKDNSVVEWRGGGGSPVHSVRCLQD